MTIFSYTDVFDPLTATEAQILQRASRMRGETLRSLGVHVQAASERSPADKGLVGQLVERYFSIRQNSDAAPDFPAAGIELKVVPLKSVMRPRNVLRVKERTSVSMINYHRLLEESWPSASVRKKVQAILFIYYHHLPSRGPLDHPIKEIVLWSPPRDLAAQFERDWLAVRTKIEEGKAHLISERDGKALGAATKGAAGRSVNQPRSDLLAKPRAWALKPSLTTWIFDAVRSRPVKEQSLFSALGLPPERDFEDEVLSRLESAAGEELERLASRLGIPLSDGKASTALIVRRILGLTNDKVRVREFQQQGIEVKTVPTNANGTTVYESMSFPRFDHMKVVHENWEESELRLHLQRLLVVPIARSRRDEPRGKRRLGYSFFWSPTDEELEEMGNEWTRFVRLIRDGKADKLPTAADTRFIHVRPKGRNRADAEPAPGIRSITKKCFWLNAAFVQKMIASRLPAGVLPRLE